MKYVLLLCGLGLFLLPCESANIVVYMPMPFYSHQASFKHLWQALAKRGHKITLIQNDVIIENNENITHIVLNETYSRMNKGGLFTKLADGQSILRILFTAVDDISDAFEYQLKHPEVQNLLKGGQRVDLFFTEYLVPVGMALGSKLNVPMIGIVSMDAPIPNHMAMGNPTHPVMYPDRDLDVSSVLTFKDRVVSSVFWLGYYLLSKFALVPGQERAIEKSLGVMVPLEEICKNVSMLFINADPLFNAERPLTPTTINIGGGIHISEPRPLPKDLQDYLDNAEEGVIYFSLGSNINSKQVPNATKRIILETFAQLPHKILWKFGEELAGKSQNVKIVTWVPQQDILRHKKIKLFITQAGLQSMEESIFNYVPMVALPFYGDQLNNANKMATKGFGLKLDHNKMTVEIFKAAILEVINNPRYKERTKQLANLILDQPMSGLEKAVWWTEYVLRHGHTNVFRNPSIDLPWYQYFLLDVICALLLIAAIVIYAFIKCVKVIIWSKTKLFNTLMKEEKTKTS